MNDKILKDLWYILDTITDILNNIATQDDNVEALTCYVDYFKQDYIKENK